MAVVNSVFGVGGLGALINPGAGVSLNCSGGFGFEASLGDAAFVVAGWFFAAWEFSVVGSWFFGAFIATAAMAAMRVARAIAVMAGKCFFKKPSCLAAAAVSSPSSKNCLSVLVNGSVWGAGTIGVLLLLRNAAIVVAFLAVSLNLAAWLGSIIF